MFNLFCDFSGPKPQQKQKQEQRQTFPKFEKCAEQEQRQGQKQSDSSSKPRDVASYYTELGKRFNKQLQIALSNDNDSGIPGIPRGSFVQTKVAKAFNASFIYEGRMINLTKEAQDFVFTVQVRTVLSNRRKEQEDRITLFNSNTAVVALQAKLEVKKGEGGNVFLVRKEAIKHVLQCPVKLRRSHSKLSCRANVEPKDSSFHH